MKKALSVLLTLCMVLAFMPYNAYAASEAEGNGWTLHADAFVDGVKVDPEKVVKLEKGSSIFVCFDTDQRNIDHGYAPLVGFADNYEGGMLSSKGFVVEGGTASGFGYDASKWGFGSDPFGFRLSAGELKAGTKGTLDYYLYKCDNFDMATFDFINTPRAATYTLTFEVVEKAATKKANTLKATAKTVKIKYKKLKKKAQTIKLKDAIKVSKAKGKVTYTKKSGNKKISINKKTGKITVKKGLKKGTYKVKIKVKAAGNSSYKSKTKTVTVKIKVK